MKFKPQTRNRQLEKAYANAGRAQKQKPTKYAVFFGGVQIATIQDDKLENAIWRARQEASQHYVDIMRELVPVADGANSGAIFVRIFDWTEKTFGEVEMVGEHLNGKIFCKLKRSAHRREQDRLENERHELDHAYTGNAFRDGQITARIAEIDKQLASLKR